MCGLEIIPLPVSEKGGRRGSKGEKGGKGKMGEMGGKGDMGDMGERKRVVVITQSRTFRTYEDGR